MPFEVASSEPFCWTPWLIASHIYLNYLTCEAPPFFKKEVKTFHIQHNRQLQLQYRNSLQPPFQLFILSLGRLQEINFYCTSSQRTKLQRTVSDCHSPVQQSSFQSWDTYSHLECKPCIFHHLTLILWLLLCVLVILSGDLLQITCYWRKSCILPIFKNHSI